MKKTIWSSFIEPEDYEWYFSEIGKDEADEVEKFQIAQDLNDGYLDDERANLNVPVKEGIVTVAELGLWYGKSHGYFRKDMRNISDCLTRKTQDANDYEFFVDEDEDLIEYDYHHDGINSYLMRAWRKGTTDEIKEKCLDAIYESGSDLCLFKTALNLLKKHTRPLGPDIAKVYGWDSI